MISGLFLSQKTCFLTKMKQNVSFELIFFQDRQKISTSRKTERGYTFLNLIKRINFRCKQLNFFSNFGFQFFHCLFYSGVKKCKFASKIFLSELAVLLSPERYQKPQIVLNFPDDATKFFSKIKEFIPSFRFQSECFYLRKKTQLKNPWIGPLHHKPDSPKILRSAMIFRFISMFKL